jgi:hypothetical protein
MSIEILITLAAGITASLAGSLLYSVVHRLFPRRRHEEGIQERVKRLTKSLEEATSLIANIEAEITARSTLATQLQKDIDQYNKLVELKKPEVEAVAQLLRGELKKENRGSFWKGFAVNFVFFILGACILGY